MIRNKMMNDLFIRGVKIKFDDIKESSYVKEIQSIKNTKELTFNKNVTFFSGENGSGKSTLLEAIAINYGFNPEGGSKNFAFSIKETHSDLNENITLIKGTRPSKDGFFLRAESFYNVASKLDEYGAINSYGGTSLHQKSHGESFLSLVEYRFWGKGLYILDEPEAALSVERQFTLLIHINRLAKEGAQFIIATHSPILLALPSSEILSFDNDDISKITYEETSSYQLMKTFIENKDYMLKLLLE
ncbi:AAA family ATPase [Anaerofustis stercorihominis]|uniref:AAA family ATPase n=1 Tax=Anaerofustis stercorihominis TaxID=214853 RepID=UPI00210A9F7E|nr:AAA family ATPase [Anaerofustis stercorihominis]MCQ4795867.1 AAA family ATPase [Anaerofustis stercorihominis]